MRTILLHIIFLFGCYHAFGSHVQVELVTKHGDDLEYLTNIEILDSLGNSILKKENQGKTLIADLADSINGKFRIRITAMGYFPIEFEVDQQPMKDSILISNVLLVPALRRKLPRNATCGTFAPRKKDIPKKIYIKINGTTTILVPDKNDVIGITYIRK